MSVLATLGKIIPPPHYMQLPSAGVDISDSSLKYVQFQMDTRSGTQLELLHWGDIDIADGALKRGTVHEAKQLSEAIREVKERTGVDNVRVSLPEERAYLFETEIKKGTPLREIRGLLEFKLEENVPLSPRDAFFDYDIIDSDKSSNMMRVSVTAYARDTVMSYYDACVVAGVVPLSFEVEAQAIARATIPSNDSHTHMIVDFGRTRTGTGLVHKGVLMYTSTIDIGGADLSAALRAKLGDRPESELTNIKNTIGLIQEVNNTDVYDAISSTVSSITDEIKTRIQYWNNKELDREERQIQSIIMCGGSVNMKGLPSYFTDELGITSERADVWQNAFSLDVSVPNIGKRYSYGYATAIGLALTTFH